MGDGSGLLKPETIKLMQKPIVTATGLDVMGLSWFITPIGDTPVLRHGGATHGFTADFAFVPSRQFAITTLTNSSEGSSVYVDLRVNAIKSYLGIAWPETPRLVMAEEQLATLVGRYDAPEEWVELTLQAGGMIMQSHPKGGFPTPDVPPGETPPPTRLAFWDADKVIALDEPFKGARGEFLRNPAGSIAWFRFGSRVHAPMQ
jgi:hypothetical protein